MNWFNKHADSIAVIGFLVASMWWMHSEFKGVDGRFTQIEARFAQIDLKFADAEIKAEKRFASIEKDLAVIKTAIIMKEVMPRELAKESKKVYSWDDFQNNNSLKEKK